jgi:pimeloyl-ACP methyl ester carboxylesterase
LAALNLGAGPVIPAGSLITATGHSLGGHLALLLGRLFPNSVDGVFTYNAPGISTNGERLLQLLGVQPIGGGKVANVASAMGAEAVSRIWGKPGAKIGVYTEPGGALYTHSIVPLSDALALYGVIATLAPDLSTNYREIARLIAASSVRPESSLEQAL